MMLVAVIGGSLTLFAVFVIVKVRLSLAVPDTLVEIGRLFWSDRDRLTAKGFQPFRFSTALGSLRIEKVIDNWFSLSPSLFHVYSGTTGKKRYSILFSAEKVETVDLLTQFVARAKLLSPRDIALKVVGEIEPIGEYHGYVDGIHHTHRPLWTNFKDNVLIQDRFVLCEPIEGCLVNIFSDISSRKSLIDFLKHLARCVDLIKGLHEAKLSLPNVETSIMSFIIRSTDGKVVLGDLASLEELPFFGFAFDLQIIIDIVNAYILDKSISASKFVSEAMRAELENLRTILHQGYAEPRYDEFKSVLVKCSSS